MADSFLDTFREYNLRPADVILEKGDGLFGYSLKAYLFNRLLSIILDTKYKRPDKPSSDDIAQAAAYAESKRCCEAILVYPSLKTGHTKSEVGRIRVRSIPFSLDADLESAGQTFLAQILETTSS
jgi:hypothetical protein